MLFADDQVIIANGEDNLQRAAHKLNQIITEYGLTISVQKTKSMAFRGGDPVRTHNHHHVQEGLGLILVPCIIKMKLVPPSLPRSSYVSSSFWFIL